MKKTSGSIESRLLGLERRVEETKDTVNTMHSELHRVERQLGNITGQFIKIQDQIHDEFAEFRSKIYTLLDPIASQLKKFNEEQSIHAGQHQETYEKMEKLEKIHPKFSHSQI